VAGLLVVIGYSSVFALHVNDLVKYGMVKTVGIRW
jgi:hypothetical protein